jgi:hypothetical protein
MAEDDKQVNIKELVDAINSGSSGGNKLQWIAVVGVGTFLIMGIVPWMMYMISEVVPANTKALVSVEAQSEDVEEELGRTRRAITKLSSLLQEEEIESMQDSPPEE